MEPVYTTTVTATGGRFKGRVQGSEGSLDLEVNPPGQGEGTNPEELFAAGYAACFANAVILGARRAKLDPAGVEVAVEVALYVCDDGADLGVRIDVRAPAIPQDAAEELLQTAHGRCPYSRATRGNVDVQLAITGAAAVAS